MAFKVLIPNGDGDESSLHVSGSPTHWEAVADLGTGYIHTEPYDSGTDLFTLSPLTEVTLTTHVTVFAYLRVSGWYGDSHEPEIIFKIGGTKYYTTIDVWQFTMYGDSGYKPKYVTRTTNPYTGLNWTTADIANLQVGVRLNADFGYRQGLNSYCHQIAVVVTNNAVANVLLDGITNITETTAIGKGWIYDIYTFNGLNTATQHGYCWSTSRFPTTTSSHTSLGVPSNGQFQSTMTGLIPGTKYYARPYVSDIWGTRYGGETTFWAGRGTIYPYEPLTRIAGITRTCVTGLGGQAGYQAALNMGGISNDREAIFSTFEAPETAGTKEHSSHTRQAYGTWLSKQDPQSLLALFGNVPTYQEWLSWMIG